ncbi:MAG: hypothetical protein MK212_16150, partial [Saprospiraceae bacterium]|nr:hypothetical protein [Saprospiraceae bacterium]
MINIRFYSLIMCCCLFVLKAQSQAPVLQTIVASDPDNLDGIYSLGDVFTLTFDLATNQAAINTKAEIDAIFAFSENLGANYTGSWLSPTVAEITITSTANHAAPSIGSTTVDVLAASSLMDAGNTIAATAGTYGAITGSF